MEFLKNKLLWALVVTIAVVAAFFWSNSTRVVTQSTVTEWIVGASVNQFCGVIYPRISSCVTLPKGQCNDVATKEIEACIAEGETALPETATPAEAKTLYNSYSQCFAERMHNLVLDNYAKDTEECSQVLM